MSKGIDYSKWDKMNFSDDEDSNDDEMEVSTSSHPRVTRLDEPSRVTCAQDGSIHIQNGGEMNTATTTATTTSIKYNSHSHDGISSQKPMEELGNNDDISTIKKNISTSSVHYLTKNGGSYKDPVTNIQTYWSQTRYEVVLSIEIDHTNIASRDIRVKVTGSLNYKDRFAAVGGNRTIKSSKEDDSDSNRGEIYVHTKDGREIFKGSLAYHIYLPEGDDDVDWEIDATNPKMKLVKITLLKALPMQGLTIWWSKPILDYPEIDVVKDIEDRNKDGTNDKTSTSSSKQEELKRVWDEAHRMFRENIKNRQKQTINIDC